MGKQSIWWWDLESNQLYWFKGPLYQILYFWYYFHHTLYTTGTIKSTFLHPSVLECSRVSGGVLFRWLQLDMAIRWWDLFLQRFTLFYGSSSELSCSLFLLRSSLLSSWCKSISSHENRQLLSPQQHLGSQPPRNIGSPMWQGVFEGFIVTWLCYYDWLYY